MLGVEAEMKNVEEKNTMIEELNATVEEANVSMEKDTNNTDLLQDKNGDFSTQPHITVEINTKPLNTKQSSEKKGSNNKKKNKATNLSMDYGNSNVKDAKSTSGNTTQPKKKQTNRSVENKGQSTKNVQPSSPKNKNKNLATESNKTANLFSNAKSLNSTTNTNTTNSNIADIVNRLYNTGRIKKNLEEKPKPRNLAVSKPLPRMDDILNRFKELQIEKANKIEEMKKKLQLKEDENIKKVPKINDRSKRIGETSEDFLTRMQKYKENHDQKYKELTEKQEAKRIEMENKINEERNKKYKKLSKSVIIDKITTMYEWDNNRKEKNTKLQEAKFQKEVQGCTFKPDINKNSNRIANAKKQYMDTEEITTRLYKQDVIKRKQRLEILEDIYAPSFNPSLNSSFKNGNLTTDPHKNYQTESGNKVNRLNAQYFNQDHNMISEILKERVKLIRNKYLET